MWTRSQAVTVRRDPTRISATTRLTHPSFHRHLCKTSPTASPVLLSGTHPYMSNLLVRIVRLPQRGQLFDSTSSSLLAAGDFLFSGVPSEVSYLSSVPANGTDSFFFEVVDAADSSAASLPVEQLVAIRNKNQPPTLVVSTEPFFVHSYFEYSASPSSVLTLHSISFGDIDGGADLVVVLAAC